jgi:hypothetical protein
MRYARFLFYLQWEATVPVPAGSGSAELVCKAVDDQYNVQPDSMVRWLCLCRAPSLHTCVPTALGVCMQTPCIIYHIPRLCLRACAGWNLECAWHPQQ